MGGCLSLRYKYVPSSTSALDLAAAATGGGHGSIGLTGNTFSHYSLTSATSCLDLYPAIRYVEGTGESEEDDISYTESSCDGMRMSSSGRRHATTTTTTRWRRSSVPLIDEWGEIVLRDEDNDTTCATSGETLITSSQSVKTLLLDL